VGALGRAQAGSTLVATVIISALIGTVLCSYLALIANRNQVAMRALAWNTAMPVLEAGIEEALTHLNRDSNSPTANYWTADQVNGKAVYWKYRALPDGSYFYVTNFNVASPSPIIQSAGYVRSPLSDNQYISRVVQVTATNPLASSAGPLPPTAPSGSPVVPPWTAITQPTDPTIFQPIAMPVAASRPIPSRTTPSTSAAPTCTERL